MLFTTHSPNAGSVAHVDAVTDEAGEPFVRRVQRLTPLVVSLASTALVTVVLDKWLHISNAATVSTAYLLVVLIVAATSPRWIAVITSVVAMLCFNYFFLPPVGQWTIDDPHNWVALFSFLAVSLVASHLSSVAHARRHEAVARRDELARLFDLSRDVLVMTDSREAFAILARSIGRRFDLAFVALALPRDGGWEVFQSGAQALELDHRQLSTAFATAHTSMEFDAYARTYAGHGSMRIGDRTVRLIPLRVGTKPIGLLAAAGRTIEAGTLDTLAGVVAIAIERAQFLEERRAAAQTRQNDELKSALLASLSHDLRTPLTSIRVAATNVKASALDADQRREQIDLILADVERLTRLFENILEMARLDAGAVVTEARWSPPSEIIAAAREQVAHTLQRHRLDLDIDQDEPLQIDGRITASAVAHLLENAAQYAPAHSTIDVVSRITDDGLMIKVRDRGPGIAPADLPHLFDRFFRGTSARGRASGTGMGLWIARGLLAVEHGRIWAENCSSGGAEFTVVVPAARKSSEPGSEATT